MRLNYDCIRDILIYIADNQHYQFDNTNKASLRSISRSEIQQADELSSIYSPEDILYSLEVLRANEYIKTWTPRGGQNNRHGMFDILDINPNGHEFLDTMKSPTIWNASVARVEKVAGTRTLPALMGAGKYLLNLAITDPESFGRILQVLGIQ